MNGRLRFDSVQATAVAAALFLAASTFAHTVALRLLLLFAATLCAATAAFRHRESLQLLPPIWLSFALWGSWVALSLAWSEDPARSSKEFRNEIVYTALALWSCSIGAQSRIAPRVFFRVLVAATVVLCGLSIYDFVGPPDAGIRQWHGDAGDHSSALLTIMPCALAAAWYASRHSLSKVRVLSWIFPALLLISAYTTLNRTVWVGFAAQFLLLGVLIVRRDRRIDPARTRWIGASLAAVALVTAVGAIFITQAVRENAGGKGFQSDTRFALWPHVLERIGERPWTGYGFGRGLLGDDLRKEFASLDTHLWHAHNLFLETMLQLGVPGLLLLLLLLGVTVREGWRYARKEDDAVAACGIALIGVVAGMVLRNMTDSLWIRQNALLYWGIVGVLLAWGTYLRSTANR